MRFNILTIFPHLFDSFLNESLIKKSIQKKLNKICVHDLRRWTEGKHKQVDDRPYGGGPGMVLMARPIIRAVKEIKSLKHPSAEFIPSGAEGLRASKNIKALKQTKKERNRMIKVILLSPGGKQFDQKMAERFSQLDQLIFICGRYEGVDERVKKIIDEEISIGPYLLSGGELATMVIIESVARLTTGYLGNPKSLLEETLLVGKPQRKEYPQYTRPEMVEINGRRYRVPNILLSGDHKKIKAWQQKRFRIKEAKN